MEKMSDSVLIILILCITYVITGIIDKWNPGRGKHEAQRKDGAKH
jgi:hypothetical protein